MSFIIIVDNKSRELDQLIERIERDLHLYVKQFLSITEAKKFAEDKSNDIKVLILNLSFSLKAYTPIKNIFTILITGNIPLQSRNLLLSEKILDTVTDYSSTNLKYIITLLQRQHLVNNLTVLICDNQDLTSSLITRSLKSIGISSKAVKDGNSAIKLIKEDCAICMVFIGRSLSKLNEFTLVEKIREHKNKFDLPIIGLVNEEDDEETEIRFLRKGATDCIEKRFSTPLSIEYFQSRVMLNFQQVISRIEIQNLAQRDFLTGLLNRRHFFEMAHSVFENYKRGNIRLATAMVDIDNFKNVNDTYGHPAGDLAIIELSKELEKQLRKTDIISRFGGEEFCIILTGSSEHDTFLVMDRVRSAIENLVISVDDTSFSFTVSIGLSVINQPSLDEAIKCSDALLYKAKEQGKNRVITDFKEV